MKQVDLQHSERLFEDGLEYSSFKVRLAQNDRDRDAVYHLRYRVFNEELGEGIPENEFTKRDIDKFDPYCDHLMVEKDGEVVGTYRFLPGKKVENSLGFYSESEFLLRKLPVKFEEAIEMGRACILPQYRKQATLLCLLCGLRHYMNLMNCQYLFGMASFHNMSHENALATLEQIKKLERVVRIPGVEALPEMRIPRDTVVGIQPQIPALLTIYFKLGAYVCDSLAYDPIFKCHDVLTFLKFEEIPEKTWIFLEKFAKRSGRDESAL